MAEAKTREELEAEWWERWHAEDFTWEGLKKRPLEGWIVADGHLREEWSGRTFGDSSFPRSERVEGMSATLQDYWRAAPDSGRLRNDTEMGDELFIFNDQPTYHLVHLPLIFSNGQATAKEDWDADRLDAIVTARLLLTKQTTISFGGNTFTQSLVDRRAQLQGVVWLKALSPPNDDTGVLHLQCEFSYFAGKALFKKAKFSESTTFNSAFFSKKARFDEATFLGKGAFEGAHFSSAIYFEGAKFPNGANFKNSMCGDLLEFAGAAFSKGSTFVEASFGGPCSFESVVFDGEVDFTRATFAGAAFFQNSKFLGFGNFSGTSFFSECRFPNSTFGVGGDFGAVCLKAPDFVGANLHPAVSFRGLNMTGLGRAAFRAQLPALIPAALVVVFAVLFLWNPFSWPGILSRVATFLLLFVGVLVWLWWILDGCGDRLRDALPAKEVDYARALVKVSAENRNHLDEARFFRHQLKAQRLELPNSRRDIRARPITWLIAKPAEKSIGMLYELVSDYGLSFLRPVFALLALMLANAVLLWYWEAGWVRSQHLPTSLQRIEAGFDASFLEAVNYSVSRAFPFGPWGEISAPDNEVQLPQSVPAEGCAFAARILAVDSCRPEGVSLDTPAALEGHRLVVRTLGLVQSLITIVLLFLLGLALRRRFQIS